jgi:hypothetical protein
MRDVELADCSLDDELAGCSASSPLSPLMTSGMLVNVGPVLPGVVFNETGFIFF